MANEIKFSDLVAIFSMANGADLTKSYANRQLIEQRNASEPEIRAQASELEKEEMVRVHAMQLDDTDWVTSHSRVTDPKQTISKGPLKSVDGHYTVQQGKTTHQLTKGDFIVADFRSKDPTAIAIMKTNAFNTMYVETNNF